MINRILLAFFILHSSFFISLAQPITPPIPSTPFTRTFLRATNAEAAVATLGMTAVTLTNYAGTAAAATNAQYAGYATNIPWSAVTTAAGAEAEPNLTLSTLTVGDVVGGAWGVGDSILYGDGSGLTNLLAERAKTFVITNVLTIGGVYPTVVTSSSAGLAIDQPVTATSYTVGSGGPRLTASGADARFTNFNTTIFGGNVLYITTNRVGINKVPGKDLDVNGNIAAGGDIVSGTYIQCSSSSFFAVGSRGRIYSPATNVLSFRDSTGNALAAIQAASADVTNTLTASNLVLSVPAWKDHLTSPTVLSKGGTATTRELLTPLQRISVEGWPVGAYGDGEAQFNHDAAITNAAFPAFYVWPHIHISSTNVTAALTNSAWRLDYNWTTISASFVTNSLTGTNTITNTFSGNWKHELVNFTPITNNAASGAISSVFTYTVERVTSGPGDVGDTTGITRVHDFDIHYPVNRLGSSTAITY